MANAEVFVSRINQIVGVSGCLLVRKDGMVLGQTAGIPESYANLMISCGGHAANIGETSGFGQCRHLCFRRENNRHFYVFLINRFLLGVEQQSECSISDMLEAIYRLLGRVSHGKSREKGS